MANEKISELLLITDPGDVNNQMFMPIVDPTEASDADKNKAVRVDALVPAPISNAGSGMTLSVSDLDWGGPITKVTSLVGNNATPVSITLTDATTNLIYDHTTTKLESRYVDTLNESIIRVDAVAGVPRSIIEATDGTNTSSLDIRPTITTYTDPTGATGALGQVTAYDNTNGVTWKLLADNGTGGSGLGMINAGDGIIWDSPSTQINIDLIANSGLDLTGSDGTGQLTIKGIQNYTAIPTTQVGFDGSGNLVVPQIAAASVLAGSGITESGGELDWGGAITQDTTITSGGFAINLGNTVGPLSAFRVGESTGRTTDLQLYGTNTILDTTNLSIVINGDSGVDDQTLIKSGGVLSWGTVSGLPTIGSNSILANITGASALPSGFSIGLNSIPGRLAGNIVNIPILDEDDMLSDSDSAVATQQSIKAYVDANAGGSLNDGSGTTFNVNQVDLGGAVTSDVDIDATGTANQILIQGGQGGLSSTVEFDIPASGISTWTSTNAFGEVSKFTTTGAQAQMESLDALSAGVILNLNRLTGGVFTDNRAVPTGLMYPIDYSATYTNRSLVDKEYVDNSIPGLTENYIGVGDNSNQLDGTANLTWDDQSLFVKSASNNQADAIHLQNSNNTVNTRIGYGNGTGVSIQQTSGSSSASIIVKVGAHPDITSFGSANVIVSAGPQTGLIGNGNTLIGNGAGTRLTSGSTYNTFIGSLVNGGGGVGDFSNCLWLGASANFFNIGFGASPSIILNNGTLENSLNINEPDIMVLNRVSDLYLGYGKYSASTGTTNIRGTKGFGTDIDGQDIHIYGGEPTGTGDPGDIVLGYTNSASSDNVVARVDSNAHTLIATGNSSSAGNALEVLNSLGDGIQFTNTAGVIKHVNSGNRSIVTTSTEFDGTATTENIVVDLGRTGVGTFANSNSWYSTRAALAAPGITYTTLIGDTSTIAAGATTRWIGIGNTNSINGSNSVIISPRFGSVEQNGVAIGDQTIGGPGSVALGYTASNGGFGTSIALGAGATNTKANQLMIGGSGTLVSEVVIGRGEASTGTDLLLKNSDLATGSSARRDFTIQGANTVPAVGTHAGEGGYLILKGSAGANTGGSVQIQDSAGGIIYHTNDTGQAWNGNGPIAKPTVTGSRGGNAALDSLLIALDNLGLITNNTIA